jgi:hypothetical protein
LNIEADKCNPRYNFALYDTEKQSCPCGKVIDLSNDISVNNNNPNVAAGCCGTTQIDTNHKTCCPKKIYDIDPAIGLTCCADDGQTLYNPGYQVCCGGKSSCSTPCNVKKVTRSLDGVEEVEESEAVEAVEEVEADKKKSDKSKKKNNGKHAGKVQCGNNCCDGKGYFTQYQKCCNGNILDYNSADANTSPMACCGSTIYNTNFDKCCIETNIKSVNRCGIKADVSTAVFDEVSQICCGNGVISF